MFDSLKSWLKIPFQYKKKNANNDFGQSDDSDWIDSKCFCVVENVNIVTDTGIITVSNSQLYLLPNTLVDVDCTIKLDGRESKIQKFGTLYSKEGKAVLRIAYL